MSALRECMCVCVHACVECEHVCVDCTCVHAYVRGCMRVLSVCVLHYVECVSAHVCVECMRVLSVSVHVCAECACVC